jgi:hypothetical protein
MVGEQQSVYWLGEYLIASVPLPAESSMQAPQNNLNVSGDIVQEALMLQEAFVTAFKGASEAHWCSQVRTWWAVSYLLFNVPSRLPVVSATIGSTPTLQD